MKLKSSKMPFTQHFRLRLFHYLSLVDHSVLSFLHYFLDNFQRIFVNLRRGDNWNVLLCTNDILNRRAKKDSITSSCPLTESHPVVVQLHLKAKTSVDHLYTEWWNWWFLRSAATAKDTFRESDRKFSK